MAKCAHVYVPILQMLFSLSGCLFGCLLPGVWVPGAMAAWAGAGGVP